ncbi:MAG: Obg family GTPase CgtA, partial [Phycisphaerae bacterium]
QAVRGLDTLLDVVGRHHWIAQNGRPGEGGNRHGRNGRNLTIRVPVGTLVYDRRSQLLLKDLLRPGQRIVVARGGKGGRGNAAFATPSSQTPRQAEPGQPGQQRWLRLELKLIADVGIIGLPNAGKSTLLSRLSRARPKIADYPFTTTEPQLGIVELSGLRRFVMADLPGLIEGAHRGAGLGDAFLRHVERTRVLLHLIDIMPGDGRPGPEQAYHIVRQELASYSPALTQRPELVVANKMDLAGSLSAVDRLRDALGREVLAISAVAGEGLQPLLERLWELIELSRQADPLPLEPATPAGQQPQTGAP